MADDHREEQTPDRISDDELRELLAAEGYLFGCPACGARVWTLLNDAMELAPFVPAHTTDDQKTPRRIDCAILLCRNCGYMRFHEQSIFGRFMEGLREALNDRRAKARQADLPQE